MKTNVGFTLLELIVSVVILGIVAAFATPGYYKIIERSYEKNAVSNLRLIGAAEVLYQKDVGTYYPSAGACVDYNAVNTNLGLKLDNVNIAYRCCPNGGGANFTCYALKANNRWEISIVAGSNSPCCTNVGACPTRAVTTCY